MKRLKPAMGGRAEGFDLVMGEDKDGDYVSFEEALGLAKKAFDTGRSFGELGVSVQAETCSDSYDDGVGKILTHLILTGKYRENIGD